MPVCISDARPGGIIRYEWTLANGSGFNLTGEYLELEPYSRIVHVERMHLPGPTPDNHIETRFDPDGAGTMMSMRMTLPDAETRSRMLRTGMEPAAGFFVITSRASYELVQKVAVARVSLLAAVSRPPLHSLSARSRSLPNLRAAANAR